MDNNLLEFGGAGSLIATAICDFEDNGIFYKKGDIVLDLEDVFINFNYSTNTKQVTSKRRNAYYNEYYLSSLSIDVAPLNFQTQKLFANMTQNNINIMVHEKPEAMRGMLLLVGQVANSDNIYIPGINNFDVKTNNNISIITSLEFKDSEKYDVYYEETVNCNSIDLDNADSNLPYLKLQILFKGNEDKLTAKSIIIVDKAYLRLTPLFNLHKNSVSRVKLLFIVIDSENNPTLNVINNE